MADEKPAYGTFPEGQNPPQGNVPQGQPQLVPQGHAVGQPVIMPLQFIQLQPHAMIIQCPFCNQQAQTRTVVKPGLLTLVLAVLLCPLMCCCLPFLVDETKDVDHFCSNCSAFLGTRKRVG